MTADSDFVAGIPLGLYVHLPWCIRKCPYCDFNSHQLRGDIPHGAYIDCLLADLETDSPAAHGREISSIYMGGGTPSLFPAREIGRLLKGIRACLPVQDGAEISLEANPGTIEHDSFSAYADVGVNRVSLGVQSFDDARLEAIGRIHGRAEVAVSLQSLRRSGINNFNVDLMFGLPGQTHKQALDDMRRALDSGATHISHYQLTIEPNTAFAASPPKLPANDSSWAMQAEAAALLEDAGFGQYEISAWARPGSACDHNLNYWRYGDFLGIGAGAHAKLSAPGGRVKRLAKSRHPSRYMGGDVVADEREIDGREIVFEYFLNRLRLRENINPEEFTARTGLPWDWALPGMQTALRRGLLASAGSGYSHTDSGWRFVNDLQALFLP
ncbi:MAG: radical SAM family heme chaperone HemW [Xanthomonadales bacterium]|nr:radical SAM family heme chaperone HemW [Xanthomonadales bacterium]